MRTHYTVDKAVGCLTDIHSFAVEDSVTAQTRHRKCPRLQRRVNQVNKGSLLGNRHQYSVSKRQVSLDVFMGLLVPGHVEGRFACKETLRELSGTSRRQSTIRLQTCYSTVGKLPGSTLPVGGGIDDQIYGWYYRF
jgi:hypothetical protein